VWESVDKDLLSCSRLFVTKLSQSGGMMNTVDTHGSFDDALSGSSSHVKEIARRLRKLIIDLYPEVVEVPWPKQKD
jgi:hypothetical protein